MSAFPLLKCQDLNCWSFKAEGFDSIILGWTGPSDSEFNLKTLRLFKNQNEGYRRGNAESITDFTSRVIIQQQYIDKFIRPFIPEVDSGIPASVTQDFIEKVAKKIEPLRTEKRRLESHICTTSKVALIHEDHIPPNSLVIELKPKWGFFPTCKLIPSDSPKLSISRFQLLQRTKLKKGDIKSITNYDPIDLFSGTESGVRKAIESLVENPQGNLKIFRDQKPSKLNQSEIEELIKIFCGDLNERFLQKLLSLQRLDVWDIECMPPIIEKAGKVTWNDLISDQKVIKGVEKLIADKFCLPDSKEETQELLNNMSSEQARVFVAAFCLSQAAKDCSLMILLENKSFENPKLYVIDFDMKMPELLISHYLKTDKEIVRTFVEMESKK